MLRKRTRSVQKENQHQICDSGSESSLQSDGGNKNPKNNSFYTSIPGRLVGLSPKGLALADCDSVRSPTSPLDFLLFSGLGNPFKPSSSSPSTTATTRSSSCSSSSSFSHENGQQRSWAGLGGCGGSKLGLMSIIDSHDDDGGGGGGDHGMGFSGKVLRSPPTERSKNIILFGPKLRVVRNPKNGNQNENTNNPFVSSSPKSVPKNYAIFPHPLKPKSPLQKGSSDVLFEIGDASLEEDPPNDSLGKIRSCSLDSCRTISNLSGLRVNLNNNHNSNNNNVTAQVSSPEFIIVGSPNSNQVSKVTGPILGSSGNNGLIGSLLASEIELSEDYTCVISHGPNAKTTHIFGDCILETHSNDLSSNLGKLSNPIITITNTISEASSVQYPSDGFLSSCYSCNKKLEDGKDIYIYRGEKAFCSLNCRSLEILIDEELEKSSEKDSESSLSPDGDDDDCKELFFEPGLIAAT